MKVSNKTNPFTLETMASLRIKIYINEIKQNLRITFGNHMLQAIPHAGIPR